ncbi:ABC transporter ATP-binding protein [Massilia solisilvae]|uniref:ABC transporter ATP-binding protein n=1 Tax=Massilia solisilvae TaxID=1811225 RepID=A0ABT2BPN3_9BURK|nr:ABC transporter ATP-binding protein [Massilia solisilvae]MCS0610454.1 ABC transporter ATP-binding protein [Massilia solisilvae]
MSASNLVKSYGERRAVDGVSLRVLAGQTLGLLGPNGAGKSTTVGMLCGLVRLDAGEVLLAGEPISPDAMRAKGRIGLVPQDLALYEELPALENLRLFGALYGLAGARLTERCKAALALANLEDRARDKVATFSGGMKRRLNIACALLHEPQLLILDEPTVGVDPQSRNAIFDTLEQLKREGRSLVYTSHYMEEVERLADHIVIMDHGKVLADESPAALRELLPAQAALRFELREPLKEEHLERLRGEAGVAGISANGTAYEVRLADPDDAVSLLAWLEKNGYRIHHFATARASLEDIFLNLTGRSLRD